MRKNKIYHFLFMVGRLFSPLYSLAMQVRAALYAKGILSVSRLPMPVLSVGNLSMGGTGKTPMVIHLARLLGSKRPAIISRGYGGNSKEAVNLVSDGKTVFLKADAAGDEPVFLAESLPGVPVVTGTRRVVTGQYILDRQMADILIMDDGFQHLGLARDLNIVLFSADAPLGNGWVFPGGMLREPVAALKRADLFVVTGVDRQNRKKVESFKDYLQRKHPDTPVYEAVYQPVSLLSSLPPGEFGPEKLNNVPLFAFCGIANPDSFSAILEDVFLVKGFQAFEDHHVYSKADLAAVAGLAAELGCQGLITTEKDFVKIKDFCLTLPVWVLRVELRVEQGFDRFVLDRLPMKRC